MAMAKVDRDGRNGGKLNTGGKNPGAGRPKKLPELNALIADVLGEEKDGISAAEAILKKLRQMATSGNLKAAEMLLDRGYGKPKATTDVTTNGESINGGLLALPVEKQAEVLRIINQDDAK